MKGGKLLILLLAAAWLLPNQELKAQSQPKKVNLYMRNTGKDTLWDGKVIATWGFAERLSQNILLPSPTITVNEGDSVEITVRNVSQGDPHTIHLHGLDVDQANDGVWPHVNHMEEAVYRFRARHAGTFIYHCHVLSVVHVQMGMYGSLIVRAKDGNKNVWTNGPAFDKEYNWLTSEVDTYWNLTQNHSHMHDTTMSHDTVTVPDYKPDYFLINGKARQELNDEKIRITAKAKETVYLRLTNMGYTANTYTFPSWLNATIVEADGRPLPSAWKQDSLRVLSGERYGILLRSNAEDSGLINVRYYDMNNRRTLYAAEVPVKLSGVVSVSENTPVAQTLEVYPNPASDIAMVNLPENHTGGKLVLRNMAGQVVSEFIVPASLQQINISAGNYAPGLYLVQFLNDTSLFQSRLLLSKK